jgi:hypothetical protein
MGSRYGCSKCKRNVTANHRGRLCMKCLRIKDPENYAERVKKMRKWQATNPDRVRISVRNAQALQWADPVRRKQLLNRNRKWAQENEESRLATMKRYRVRAAAIKAGKPVPKWAQLQRRPNDPVPLVIVAKELRQR